MATSEVTTAAAPPFSPRMALYLVEEMNRQLGMIASMAFAAGSYELSKTEPDINTELLFEAIADKAGEAATSENRNKPSSRCYWRNPLALATLEQSAHG